MKKITYICDFCHKVMENPDEITAFKTGKINYLDEFIPDQTIQPHHYHKKCLYDALHPEEKEPEKKEPEPEVKAEEEGVKLPGSREEQDALILKMYDDGESYADIGRTVGLSYPTIKGRLQKMGVDIR